MIDLDKIEAVAKAEKLYICREGPERWAGGMAGPESTYVPIDYSPGVVLALVARVRELQAGLKEACDICCCQMTNEDYRRMAELEDLAK